MRPLVVLALAFVVPLIALPVPAQAPIGDAAPVAVAGGTPAVPVGPILTFALAVFVGVALAWVTPARVP